MSNRLVATRSQAIELKPDNGPLSSLTKEQASRWLIALGEQLRAKWTSVEIKSRIKEILDFLEEEEKRLPSHTHPRSRSTERGIQEQADVGDEDDADACGWSALPAAVLTHITLGESNDAERARRVEHATLPSRGSEGHGTGDCSPCVWHWKSQGCLRGSECGYCHLCPQSELKTRKKERVATLRSTSTQSHTMGLEGEGQAKPGGSEDSDVPRVDTATSRSPAASAGSNMHGTGDCRPCAWFWKKQGCQNGEACRRCHLCPEGEVKKQWKKKRTDSSGRRHAASSGRPTDATRSGQR